MPPIDRFDTATPAGRAALKFIDKPIKGLVQALGLPPLDIRDKKYSKAALCHMAVQAGLTLSDIPNS